MGGKRGSERQFTISTGGIPVSTTRRTFLQSLALCVSALPNWPSSVLTQRPRVRQATGLLRLDQVFFDARRPHALAFAETARQLGARTRAIWGDAGDPWHQEIFRRWGTRRTPLAGITDFRSLFLLQIMAADVGLRPVLRIHHGARGESAVHEAFGARTYRSLSDARLANCGECWGGEAARLVLRLPRLPEREARTMRDAGNLREADLRALNSRALVTWVIA
jgi:hypothetical protein